MLFGFFAKTHAADAERFTSGPFEISTVMKRIGAGGFPNTSANPFARTSVTNFTLKYKGKAVVIESKEGKLDTFWDAWFLDGAAQPAVLLARRLAVQSVVSSGKQRFVAVCRGEQHAIHRARQRNHQAHQQALRRRAWQRTVSVGIYRLSPGKMRQGNLSRALYFLVNFRRCA